MQLHNRFFLDFIVVDVVGTCNPQLSHGIECFEQQSEDKYVMQSDEMLWWGRFCIDTGDIRQHL